ncbi:MazG nucleotide pyrophosphohydrolase domain-containing protein [Nonomuraea typhae]|uniref:MazG nucleotide pyrophosphohydrolase domain-containing protein n=1 Tax=Nonomuraea typhae TaxID=2603600 RepID=UPI0012FC775D|nr:MazG nucleotide pyrophosphohydrolase domain-containing protein [Nonomuraea typhae]
MPTSDTTANLSHSLRHADPYAHSPIDNGDGTVTFTLTRRPQTGPTFQISRQHDETGKAHVVIRYYDPMRFLAEWHEITETKRFVELDYDYDRADLVELRMRLIAEEYNEVRAELINHFNGHGSLPHLAKELADLLYVVYGTADLLDIPLDRVMELVHDNNMRKLDPETGQIKRRSDGKILKPDGFQELSYDDIAAIITSA